MNKLKYLILVLVLSLGVVFGVSYATRDDLREFSNEDFAIQYDKSWKVKKKDTEVLLEHKKTGSVLSMQVMVLEDSFMDTDLKEFVGDIIASVERQNSAYSLIGKEVGRMGKYDSYSYLYEKEKDQVMVSVMKKDCKVVLVYYEASSAYYDIVLDSVDMILDSLDIKTGEGIPNS